ncbi:MAG: DUF2849 domain-containing protein [Pseudomonadota bacterium]
MSRPFVPVVATSNHLLEGDVIYYARPAWTRDMANATVARSEEDAESLLQEASQFPYVTVGVVLTKVDLSSGKPGPAHFREAFRTKGPSNYFHGKQAEHV